MTSPIREGRRVQQPKTSDTHSPPDGRSGKTAMKMKRQGSLASKYRKGAGSHRHGQRSHGINAGYGY